MKANVWAVFQWQKSPYFEQLMPCVVGVFDDPAKADAVCTTEDHYIFPLTLNEDQNGAPTLHPAAYYPRCQQRTDECQRDAEIERAELAQIGTARA
jgi:hypothetical protein